jgi:hypothetical protein
MTINKHRGIRGYSRPALGALLAAIMVSTAAASDQLSRGDVANLSANVTLQSRAIGQPHATAFSA